MSESHLNELRELAEKQIADEQLWQSITAAVIESLPDALIVTDEAGMIVRTNWQCEFLFGYHRSELYGKTVDILIPEHLRGAHAQHRKDYAEEPRARIMGAGQQLSGRRKNGTEIHLDISLSPVMTAQGLFVIVLMRKTRKPIPVVSKNS